MRIASFLLVVLVVFAGVARAADRPPGIVLIMADDQGWGETGYNGHPTLKTPVLDEMAAKGLRLDRFYAAAPVCSPTRAAVMTGRHPNRSGVFAPNYSTRPEEVTVAQVLKSAGYRTGHFGKWHIGAVKAESPLNPGRMGFDEYLAHDNFFEMDPVLSRNGAPPQQIKGESSAIVADEAAKFVRKVLAEGKPFFVVLWFGSPHQPYVGTPEDVAAYAHVHGEELRHRLAEITAMDRAIGSFRRTLRDLNVADNTLVWYTSDNGITHEGIPADQMPGLYNGGWRGHKGSVYEGGLRVPAVIEWPAVIRQPRRSDVACVSSDILPTLLDLLGLKHRAPNRPLDGISLRPLIEGRGMSQRPSPIGFWRYPANNERGNEPYLPVELSTGTTPTARTAQIQFLNFRHPVARTDNFGGEAAWTDSRYKLLVNDEIGQGAAKGKGKKATKNPGRNAVGASVELYDLSTDPYEQRNISADHPQIVERMRKELRDWQRSVEQSLSGADYR